MKNNDTVALAEAYTLVEESRFKSALAAAAMGLGSLNAHAANNSYTDEDRMNPHEPVVTQPAQQPQDEETNYHKALVAFEKARKEKIVDEQTLKRIALDQDIAKRYALYLITFGRRIPDIIKKATKGYSNDLESSFGSDTKN